MNAIPTRRSLLKAGGSLVVGFSLAAHLPRALAQAGAQGAAPAGRPGKPVALDEVDRYLAIGPDGRVTVFSG